jgi:drug/metabolite transporter (DMT)-like permease
MNLELMSVVLGLASAVSWGSGDFFGGLATRRSNVYSVVIGSQLIGLLLIVGMALLLAESIPPSGHLLFAVAAGVCGAIGLTALYQGLASGRMGVVAPVSAIVSAAIPVLASALAEGVPAVPQLTGFALALAAVWLITRGNGAGSVRWLEIGLALISGLGFGLFLVLIDQANEVAVLWPLAAARLTSLTLLSIAALLLRQRVLPARQQLGPVLLAGIGDAGGNIFFTLAAQIGRLDIAAILSSLYPAGTVLMARFFLHEHLSRRQWFGLVLALAAVVLIAL